MIETQETAPRDLRRQGIGMDPEHGHIAGNGAASLESVLVQFQAFVDLQASQGKDPSTVTLAAFLESLKPVPTEET